MYHYMEFEPYLIRERNAQIRSEVNSLRLQEQLRKINVRGSRLITFAFRAHSFFFAGWGSQGGSSA